MQMPPFKLAAAAHVAAATPYRAVACCGQPGHDADTCADACANVCADSDADAGHPTQRARLADLEPHLHCSVIGTCLGTAELRKLVARFVDVQGASDLAVHHEAVTLATQGGEAARTLSRALDRRHDAELRRFGRVRDATDLQRLWTDALRQGEVPGAYWALLTHRATTPALRQLAFGDVHMLSHLVGASHRADLRRQTALEHDNTALRERQAQQQDRLQALDEERLELQAALARQASELAAWKARASAVDGVDQATLRERLADARALLALHTERRERAEHGHAAAAAESSRLQQELAHSLLHNQTLAAELAAAEQLLREPAVDAEAGAPALARQLEGRRVLYVGGRPSSAVAIRDLVQRHGGDLQRHDGGLEDRKGLLLAAVAWAEVVVFPVDCIDHDSAGRLKRLCQRDGKPLLPLRSASVTSFAAALLSPAGWAGAGSAGPAACRRHA